MKARKPCLLFALLLLACTPVPKPPPELTPPDWQDGETSRYEIVRNDSVLYNREIKVEFDEEEGAPTVLLTSVVRSAGVPFFFFDSTTLALTRYTLKPLWCYRVVSTEISITELELDFEPDRVLVEKTTVEGAEKKTFRSGAHTYSIEMLQHLLRAVPLEPGLSFDLDLLIPLEFRTLRVNLTVLGTKLVSTPLGDILCREIGVIAQRRRLRLLYELAEPHRLVGIRDLENLTETRLVDYIPAAPDTTGELP